MNIFAKSRAVSGQNGISSLEKVQIGGVDQWVLIRGENTNNPVLFMVHGGPGQSEIYLSHVLNEPLEKHFVIVNWDQRGAAKSYSLQVQPEAMNLNQFISDGEEVIQYVQARLNKQGEKFHLHGHSFGTMLCMLMINRYPQYFRNYVGTAQAVNLQENLMVSYDYVLRKAKTGGNKKAVQDLEAIGRPPFYNFSKGLWKYSVWLEKFGGKMRSREGREVFKAVFSAPEYSLKDKINFFRGSLFSVKHMHQELLQTDIRTQVPKVEIPVHFFLGKYDYSVPFELAEDYLMKLEAPKKGIVWFEQSGHMPHYEEPERYCDCLIRILQNKN